MTTETDQTIEYVWDYLQDRIEYESTSVHTSEDDAGEITVRSIEFGNSESCEIVSHTYNEQSGRQTIQEIMFYHSDDTVHSFENKTIEQTINIIIACYPEFDVVEYLKNN